MLTDEERARRRAAARRETARQRILRRRLVAGAVVAAVAVGGIALATGGGGGGGGKGNADARPAPPPELPRGGRVIFPRFRVVAFYGAPQDPNLGVLGIGTPTRAMRRLRDQARSYRGGGRPVLPAAELLAAVAARSPGADGLYRLRQDSAVIDRYLAAARRAKALFLLDIQPGYADFMDEARALERYLREPDVGLALDPEWSVVPGQVPGRVIGSTTAAKINEVSRWLSEIVRRGRLPQKLLVIHQFTEGMIQDKATLVRTPGVALTINVDGFGGREVKLAKYRSFVAGASGAFNGFKLFYVEDTNLLRPRDVLRMRPRPDLVVYE